MGTAETSPAGVRGGGRGTLPSPGRTSLLLRAPGDVVGAGGRVVLVDQLLHNLPGVVQLIEVVLEDVLLAELLQEGLPLAQLVVLPARPLKQLESSAVVKGAIAPWGPRRAGGGPNLLRLLPRRRQAGRQPQASRSVAATLHSASTQDQLVLPRLPLAKERESCCSLLLGERHQGCSRADGTPDLLCLGWELPALPSSAGPAVAL